MEVVPLCTHWSRYLEFISKKTFFDYREAQTSNKESVWNTSSQASVQPPPVPAENGKVCLSAVIYIYWGIFSVPQCFIYCMTQKLPVNCCKLKMFLTLVQEICPNWGVHCWRVASKTCRRFFFFVFPHQIYLYVCTNYNLVQKKTVLSFGVYIAKLIVVVVVVFRFKWIEIKLPWNKMVHMKYKFNLQQIT